MSGHPTIATLTSACIDAIVRSQSLFQGLRQRCPEGLHSATRIMGWLRMTSAPDRPEAALQFALRESTRKTVTPGKDFCSAN